MAKASSKARVTDNERGSKSSAVREILESIGAVSKDPPPGWVSKTMAKLEAKGIAVSQPLIYTIRSQMLEQAGLEPITRTRRSTKAVPQKGEVTGACLIKVKELIDKHGGLDEFEERFASFRKIVQEIGLNELESAIDLLKRLR
jgi:hypothetical protein